MSAPQRIRSFPLEPAEPPAHESFPAEELRSPSTFTDTVRAKLSGTMFDPMQALQAPPAVYKLDGKIIATKGNISVLKGPEKAGKSAVIGAALASAISAGDPEVDTLGFTTSNAEGHLVLHIDCEQSQYHHALMMHKVMRRARVEKLPEWINSHGLRGFSTHELRSAIEILMADGAQRFGGIHSVWIDGFADLVANVNDTDTVGPVVAELMELSTRFSTAIFGVVHQNPNANADGKARGVIGSELQRKVETTLCVSPVGPGFVLHTSQARGAPIAKDDGIRYIWDGTSEMFVTDTQAKAIAQEERRGELLKILDRVLPGGAKMGYNDLKGAIMKDCDISDGGAKSRIKEMKSLNLLKQTEEKQYTRSN